MIDIITTAETMTSSLRKADPTQQLYPNHGMGCLCICNSNAAGTADQVKHC